MSLLMDALRKAEQQKRQGAETGSVPGNPGADRLSLEPLVPEKATGQDEHLPELPQRLEDLDDQFFTSDPRLRQSIRALADAKLVATETVPPAGSKPEITPREAAQNVFAAKQPATNVSHGFAIAVGVTTMIAIVVIGVYFYWQLQPKGGFAAGTSLAVKPAAMPSLTATSQPASPAAPAPSAAPPSPASGASVPAEQAVKKPGREPAAVMPRSAVVPGQPVTLFRPSTATAKPDTAMEVAHDAFIRGDVEQARSIWQKALLSDSRDVNALHGLAAVARQEGRTEIAAAIYRRLLAVDPKDALANAALLSLENPADARQAESRLSGLLAEQPNSSHLNFALGNLYMGDSRWADAQQAYFKAHVADPANPDYLYNLAVSLDHLHQNGLAAQYYARALAAARSQAAAFDPARAEERLKTLQADQSR